MGISHIVSKIIRWNMAIKKHKTHFVFAKKDINKLVEKYDVGMIEDKDAEILTVFFIRSGKRSKIQKENIKSFEISNTGDEFPKKICNVCHKLFKTSHFEKNQNAKNNRTVRRPSCRDCRKNIDGVQVNIKIRKKILKTKPHKIPFECPICHKRTIAGVTSKVVIDHDHKTGKIRGWICDSCNTGIGRFKDNVEILKRAIRFIK